MRAALVLAVAFFFVPQIAHAGPNAGGVLAVHDANVAYTSDTSSYCGLGSIPDSCAAIDTEIEASGPDNQRVWKVYAVFPDTSSPRLKAISFGVHYAPDSLLITAYGPCIGDLNNGAAEMPAPGWPGAETGTAAVFQDTQTGYLVECYWFAGYSSSGTPAVFELRNHPDPVLGGQFADDAVPSQLDPVAEYGNLGFAEPGYRACPSSGGGPSGPGEGPDGDGAAPPCHLPISVAIAPNNYLICRTVNDTVIYTARTIQLTKTDDTLRIEGNPIYPCRIEPARLPEATYRRLYGSVPFVVTRVNSGWSWSDAGGAYDAAIDSLTRVAHARYIAVYDSSRSMDAAVAAVAAVYHASPLDDVSATYLVPGSLQRGHPEIRVKLIGNGPFFVRGLERLTRPRPKPNVSDWDRICEVVRLCGRLLSVPTGTTVVTVGQGGVAVDGGAEGIAYLRRFMR